MSTIHLYSEYTDTAVCPACGDFIDYCTGHGEVGDPLGARTLADHDAGNHLICHPAAGCETPPVYDDTEALSLVVVYALLGVIGILCAFGVVAMLAPVGA